MKIFYIEHSYSHNSNSSHSFILAETEIEAKRMLWKAEIGIDISIYKIECYDIDKPFIICQHE